MGAMFLLMILLLGMSVVYPAIMWVRWKLFYSKKISLKRYWQDV